MYTGVYEDWQLSTERLPAGYKARKACGTGYTARDEAPREGCFPISVKTE
jgi:hypothetical protein